MARSRPLVPSHVVSALDRRRRRASWAFHRVFLSFGSRVSCPCCGWSGLRFAPTYHPRRPNRSCPVCGGGERDRALELWLRGQDDLGGARLVEIAPIGQVARSAARLGVAYTSVDLSSPLANTLGDLSQLPYGDGLIDLVLCFHVLEHVADDLAAVKEIARVLQPHGKAVVVVPFSRDLTETFEDPDTPLEQRRALYGQDDHVRAYGLDVTDRFRRAGVEVEEVPWSQTFTADERRRHVLDGDDDRFWICRKR